MGASICKSSISLLLLLASLSLVSPQTPTRHQLFNQTFSLLFNNTQCIANALLIQTFTRRLKEHKLQVYDKVKYKEELTEYLRHYQTHKKWESQFDTTYKICLGYSPESRLYEPEDNPKLTNLSISATIQKYPYLKRNMNRDRLSQLLSRLPISVKTSALRIVRYVVIDNKVSMDETFDCPQNYISFIYDRISQFPPVDFIVYTAYQTTDRDIMLKIQKDFKSQEEFDGHYELYNRILVQLPAFMVSKSLASPTQFNKFLIPDALLTFDGRETTQYINERNRLQGWDNKIERAFWRGADLGWAKNRLGVPQSNMPFFFPRLNLVNISFHNPDLVDAKFSSIRSLTTDPKYMQKLELQGLTYESMKARPQSLNDHYKYKYLVSVDDGYAYAYQQVSWILLSNSVLMRQESLRVQWFYDQLVPNVHYIPVKYALDDLTDKINYLKQNDQAAQNITKAANEFAGRRLTSKAIREQFFQIIKQYAHHQNWNPTLMQKLLFNVLMLDMYNQRVLSSELGQWLVWTALTIIGTIVVFFLLGRVVRRLRPKDIMPWQQVQNQQLSARAEVCDRLPSSSD